MLQVALFFISDNQLEFYRNVNSYRNYNTMIITASDK